MEIEKDGHSIELREDGTLFIDEKHAMVYRMHPESGQILLNEPGGNIFMALSSHDFGSLIGEIATEQLGKWTAFALYSLWVRATEDLYLRKGGATFLFNEPLVCCSPIHSEFLGKIEVYTLRAYATEDMRRDGCLIIMPCCEICESELERRTAMEKDIARNGGGDEHASDEQ